MIKKEEAFSLRAKLWIDLFSETLRIFTLRNTIHTHYNFTCQPFQRNILMYQTAKTVFWYSSNCMHAWEVWHAASSKYQNPSAMSRRCGAIRCGERAVRYLATWHCTAGGKYLSAKFDDLYKKKIAHRYTAGLCSSIHLCYIPKYHKTLSPPLDIVIDDASKCSSISIPRTTIGGS